MPFDWKEFLGVAANLKLVGCEASLRTGMSRAYYSIYGVCLIFAKNRGIISIADIRREKGGMHTFLADTLKFHDDEILQEIGVELETLRARRNDADYKADCLDYKTPKLLDESIEQAQLLFEQIREWRP